MVRGVVLLRVGVGNTKCRPLTFYGEYVSGTIRLSVRMHFFNFAEGASETYLSYSLNSLKGVKRADYIGEYFLAVLRGSLGV